jgi:hypothetical protein
MSQNWIEEIMEQCRVEDAANLLSIDDFADCVVGLIERFSQKPILCYDRAKIIAKLAAQGMTQDEAFEFFQFNIIGAWMGDGTPCFLTQRPEPIDPPSIGPTKSHFTDILRSIADERGPTGMMDVAHELEKICLEKARELPRAKAKDPTSDETCTLQRWANLASRFA